MGVRRYRDFYLVFSLICYKWLHHSWRIKLNTRKINSLSPHAHVFVSIIHYMAVFVFLRVRTRNITRIDWFSDAQEFYDVGVAQYAFNSGPVSFGGKNLRP